MRQLIAIILALTLFGAFMYGFVLNVNKVEDANTIMSGNLGRKICIQKDTLVIVDYSIWDETYTLSNGITISRKIYETNNNIQ